MQTFDDNNIIEYNTIVINITKESAKRRIDIVSELYGIIPNEIRYKDNEQDLVFKFAKPLQKA